MPTLTEDLRFRGLIHQVTDEAILARLDRGGVTAYIGFDPTARSLHVGNLVQLVTLRRLQLAGNRPIVVAGGGTGLIGDPGGRDDERQLLSEAQLAANIAAVREQLARYLDFDESAGGTQAVLVDNATWLTKLTLTDFLRDVGKHFTVNQMIAKESVRSRLDRADGGISYTEFSYMLLQSYDFYRLHVDYGCEVQLGGSDQWGNITMAIELVKKLTGDQAYGVTTPLLTKADGTKLGKSTLTDEFVWLDRSMTSPFQLYQYFVNARRRRGRDHRCARSPSSPTTRSPRSRRSWRRIPPRGPPSAGSPTRSSRSSTPPADADAAVAASEALFDESVSDLDLATLESVTADAPSTRVGLRGRSSAGVRLVELLVTTGLCSSNGEARRAIEQGGVYVNNRRAERRRRHASLRPTSSTTATCCCAEASGTRTSSSLDEAVRSHGGGVCGGSLRRLCAVGLRQDRVAGGGGRQLGERGDLRAGGAVPHRGRQPGPRGHRGAPSGDARQHRLPRAATRTPTARTPTCSRPRTPSSPNLLSTALRRLRPRLGPVLHGRRQRRDARRRRPRARPRPRRPLRRGLPRGGSDRSPPRRARAAVTVLAFDTGADDARRRRLLWAMPAGHLRARLHRWRARPVQPDDPQPRRPGGDRAVRGRRSRSRSPREPTPCSRRAASPRSRCCVATSARSSVAS